ncbi:MAG: glycerate kinase [Deltaproteobacteria bacterium]|nr:glycerate kinase [Deltaproteobacteria bacterium]MBW2051270.1 glycerate kinase [Deltaproteobacteria bacterium]MBW2139920.1 glycerate kinase [Deltaproteobacteria bacterium]MBW2322385.1 glycerate kinase [Deltaproteobacteria bacterium]
MAIFKAALKAADPSLAVKQAVSMEENSIKVRQGNRVIKTVNLNRVERIFIVGAGKATAPMAKALEQILGNRITEGIISVKKGHALDLKYTTVKEAAHPVPDQNGLKAADKIKTLLEGAGSKDLVFSLISGGGSALLPLPIANLKLSEIQDVTRLLLGCGANIHEINTVRKHLSLTKGGQLARAAAPATVINLMLSDVVGDDMDTIASGPFVPDHSSFEDMALILARYKLMKKVSSSVRNHLKKGLTGQVPETPKENDPAFNKVTNLIIGSNYLSLIAAEAKAKSLGYRPLLLSSSIEGETQVVAQVHVALAREIKATNHPVKAPACLISGGETTVTLTGQGKGGRNQEFVLTASMDMDELEDVLIFSAGTDGTDGPTDVAGAMADKNTSSRAMELGLSPQKHLIEHNSYPFFKKLDDHVITGPTLTNVMDVRLVLVK